MSHRRRFSLIAALVTAASGTAAAERQTPQWSLTFEDAPGQIATTQITHISASPENVGVALLRSAGSLTPRGTRRWQVNAVSDCPAPSRGFVDAMEIVPDGKSWVLRSCPATSTTAYRHEFLHLDTGGNVLARVDLGALPAPASPARLLAEPDGVVAVIPLSDGLRWLRIGANGSVIDDTFTELAGPDRSVAITNLRRWPNGSVSVATRQWASCNISPPIACPRPARTLLRLNADGTERWRVEAGEAPFIGFDDDGSSLIVESQGYEPLRLRQISATGVPGAAFVAANGEPLYVGRAAGPLRGRYLVFSETEQVLIDRSGNVLARRASTGTAAGGAIAYGNLGFVTGTWHSDAALVSADDLSVIAEFDVDGIDNTSWHDMQVTLLDDGSVYSSTLKLGDYGVPNRARLSRFAVPGTPAADLVFTDHFE